jgi:hypothetical protein
MNACVPSGIYLPEKFMTIDQVFPSTDQLIPSGDNPVSGYRKVTYPVSYADVFRSSEVTAVQNMMNIEKVDEDSGVILASKVTPEPQPFEQSQVCMGLKNEVRYFYAIKVEETGPSSTDVTLVIKAQGRCCYAGGATVGGAVGSMMGVPFAEWKKKCLEFSSVHYSDKQQDISQYFNFLRLNLLNAGLI